MIGRYLPGSSNSYFVPTRLKFPTLGSPIHSLSEAPLSGSMWLFLRTGGPVCGHPSNQEPYNFEVYTRDLIFWKLADVSFPGAEEVVL